MKTGIGVKEENAVLAAAELSKKLADEFVLYIKTRNTH